MQHAPPVHTPVYDPNTRKLTQGHAGVTVVITQDDANCVHLDIQRPKANPPPLVVTMGPQELFSDLPEQEEWDQMAAAAAPTIQAEQEREKIKTKVVKKMGPGTDPATIDAATDAALEAALPVPPANP